MSYEITSEFNDRPPDGDIEKRLCELWEEKSGRPETEGVEEFTLVIALEKPQRDSRCIANSILGALESTPPANAYEWSLKWGQTRIAVSPDDRPFEVRFVNYYMDESKAFMPLMTTVTGRPSELLCASPDDTPDPIQIRINDDESIRYEAAVLQIERLVDEAVWATCSRMLAESEMTPAEAFSRAVAVVKSRGFDFKYLSVSEILASHERFCETSVRLYGDRHGQNTLPKVIGLISLDSHELVPGYESSYRAAAEETVDTECPVCKDIAATKKESIPEVVAVSITAGKELHIGHMFHVVKAALHRSLNNGADSFVVEVNDTGPRIEALIEQGARLTGLSRAQIIGRIESGAVAPTELHEWYKHGREQGRSLYATIPENPSVRMEHQRSKTEELLGRLVPTSRCEALKSSDFDHGHVLAHSDPAWRATGSERIGGMQLRRKGGPTAYLTRMSFVDNIIRRHSPNRVVYVDSASETGKATRHVEAITDTKVEVRNGAAVGLDFSILSGISSTEATSMERALYKLETEYGIEPADVVKNIGYLITFMPAVKYPGKESFYNFHDVDSVVRAIDAAATMRRSDLALMESFIKKVEIDAEIEFVQEASKPEKTVVLKFLRSRAGYLINELHTGPSRDYALQLQEPARIVRASRKQFPDYSQRLAVYAYLAAELEGQTSEVREVSTTLQALQMMGYQTAELQEDALHIMAERDIELQYELPLLNLVLWNTLQTVNVVRSLTPDAHYQISRAIAIVRKAFGDEE